MIYWYEEQEWLWNYPTSRGHKLVCPHGCQVWGKLLPRDRMHAWQASSLLEEAAFLFLGCRLWAQGVNADQPWVGWLLSLIFFFVLLILSLLLLLLLRLCHYVIRFQFYTASSCMDLRASPKIMFFKYCTRTKPGRKPLHILTRNLAKGIWRPSGNCAMQLTSQAFWTRPTRVLHVMEAGLWRALGVVDRVRY